MKSNHQLAAIMFLDIYGFTALMECDEDSAILAVSHFIARLENQVPRFEGRVIQFWGDGCLVIFDCAANAVACGVAIQLEFRELKIPVRIGLSSGEIIVTDTNCYGNAVNVSSRIESIGVPGSVLLSGIIQQDIEQNTDFNTVLMGEFYLKNVTLPVEVFALINDGLIVPGHKDLNCRRVWKYHRSPGPYIFLPLVMWAWRVILAQNIYSAMLGNSQIKL